MRKELSLAHLWEEGGEDYFTREKDKHHSETHADRDTLAGKVFMVKRGRKVVVFHAYKNPQLKRKQIRHTSRLSMVERKWLGRSWDCLCPAGSINMKTSELSKMSQPFQRKYLFSSQCLRDKYFPKCSTFYLTHLKLLTTSLHLTDFIALAISKAFSTKHSRSVLGDD